ncbi:hypothetical protein D9613_001451 [Agrocybe pediades]|uniref:Uncharacterized protein n=1 Tax=Agrocybe pediades TaxID=84607 RepID=A0A8H4R5W6_9AGAR|nr:hypothetical protein D9613_001451 [Agrocybe pediades]
MVHQTRSGRRFHSTLHSNNNAAFDSGNGSILNLPEEIYLEIASHIPATPVPTDKLDCNANLLKACAARHVTLAALSQTSRALRRIFLRFLWERIEVLEGMPTENGELPLLDIPALKAGANSRARIRYKVGSKNYATELVRQLEIVTVRQPELAQLVRVINIVITEYSQHSVLSEFARSLSCFPNLHTLQISAYPRVRYGKHLHAFQVMFGTGYRFPQIQNLHLSPGIPVQLLLLCPNVRHASWRTLSTPPFQLPTRYFEAIFETVLLDYSIAEDLPRAAPNLCQVIIDLRNFDCEDLEEKVITECHRLLGLGELKHLHTFTVKVKSERTLEQWLGVGCKIFERQEAGSNAQPRKVIVVHDDDVSKEYVMPPVAKRKRLKA